MEGQAADRSKDAGASAGLTQRFYETLIALEFAPAQSLQMFQDNVLRDFIEHVARASPFYHKRLAPVIDAKGRADLTHWHDIPILTAADVADRHGELRARSIPREHGRIFRYQSSGTTSGSLAYYRSELDELATRCCHYRHVRASGLDWSKDLALIRIFDPALSRFRGSSPEGDTRKEVWGPNWLDADKLGAIHRLNVFAPLQHQIEWLSGLGEIYLSTYPSHAAALARHVKKSGSARPKLLAVITAGEPTTPDVQREVETFLGCSCFDVVSNAELGFIACECPSHRGYHLQHDLARIELLDEHDRPIRAGQWGRVIATPFYNFAMPLIRYDTGDWAKLEGVCGCGRHTPLIGPVYGRPSNLMRLPGSAWTRPDPARGELDKYLPDCRWQLVQISAEQVELRYMRYPNNRSTDTAAAKRYVQSLLDPEMSVAICEVAALGPSASGKFPAFISKTA